MFKPSANWKKSIWAKCVAACFIGLIVLGNVWLVMRFSHAEPPAWLQITFMVLVGATFASGAALGAERIFAKVVDVDEHNS